MSASPSSSFGSLLRRYRRAASLTQEVLAERAGVTPRAIIALERGERRRPYRHTIALLASALQLSISEMEMLEYAAGYSRSPREPVASEASPHAAPLVGRAGELAAIQHYLENPDPPVLVFAGEPGIGKSRLLEEAARRAQARGFAVLQGGGHRRSGQEPYAPLLDTLSRSLTMFSVPQLQAALVGCGWLVRLLPELVEIVSSPFPHGTLPVEQERRLTFGAVARYLTNIAGTTGTLLILDDLQWASPDGLDLLTFLLRSGTNGSIRVVGAYRDTEVSTDHPLSATLADLAEHNMADQLTVQPLAPPHVTELLDALLPSHGAPGQDDAVRQEIMGRAGGLPFFLVSCVQGLAARTAGTQDRSPVPWSVAQSVRQRVAALPDGARRVLQATAAVGRTAERRVLLGMGLLREHEVLIGLDAACRAGLIVLQGETEYRFAHDVIREVVEADLGAGQRMLLHRSVGESLERLPERSGWAADLAWHFLQASDPEKALHYSLLAGDEAARVFAYGEAEQYYRTALQLARDVGDADREVQALEKLGSVLWSAGRLDEALDPLERAAQAQQRAGHVEAEGRIVAQIGWVLSSTGKPEEGITLLRTVVDRLEAHGPSPAMVELYTALSHHYLVRGRVQDVAPAAERVSELAQAVGDDRTRVQGELHRALALIVQGRHDETLHVLEDVIPAAESVGDSEALARALMWAVDIYVLRGAFDRCRTYKERLVDLRERTGSPPHFMAVALAGLGEVLFLQGDWEQARVQYERAADMTATLTSPQALWVRIPFAELSLLEGKWRDAARYLEECMSLVVRTESQALVPEVLARLAQLNLEQGRPDAAIGRLEPLIDEFELDQGPLLVLAESYLDAGNALRADEVVRKGAAQAASEKNRPALVHWRRQEGRLLAGQGRWEDAEPAFSEAVSLASEMPYPFRKASALHAWGRLGVEHRNIREARERLEEALAIFQQLGARPYIERTERTLAELG